jgi:hypothetical protein
LISGALPRRQHRFVEVWAELHQDELLAVYIRRLCTDGMTADHGRPLRGPGTWRATETGGARNHACCSRKGVSRGQSRPAQRAEGPHGRKGP